MLRSHSIERLEIRPARKSISDDIEMARTMKNLERKSGKELGPPELAARKML
jgi:hypothetical protein